MTETISLCVPMLYSRNKSRKQKIGLNFSKEITPTNGGSDGSQSVGGRLHGYDNGALSSNKSGE